MKQIAFCFLDKKHTIYHTIYGIPLTPYILNVLIVYGSLQYEMPIGVV